MWTVMYKLAVLRSGAIGDCVRNSGDSVELEEGSMIGIGRGGGKF